MAIHGEQQSNAGPQHASAPEAEGVSHAPAPFQLSADGASSTAVPANPVRGSMAAPPFQLTASTLAESEGETESHQSASAAPSALLADDAATGADATAGGDASVSTTPNINIVGPSVDTVDFLSSHAMQTYGGDMKNNPLWLTGSVTHAAAYTKNATPNVNARIGLGAGSVVENVTEATVRVLDGGREVGRKDRASITPTLVDVTGLTLTGLSGSDAVRSTNNVLTWQVTIDGNTWVSLGNSGSHLLYWLEGAPTTAAVKNYAIARATAFANGSGDVPGAIRTGIRSVVNYDPADAINPDPLTVFTDGIGICTDFGNLLTLLAQSVGFTANTVMFFGGFESLGRNIWISRGGNYQNLTNVNALDNAYHPGGGATGWDFNYHVISRINGALQDAALNRPGYDAQAVHGGKIVHLLELAPGTLPAAQTGVVYDQIVPRRPHTVAVTLREYGDMVTLAAFDATNLLALNVPEAMASPIDVGVGWAAGANLPAGLAFDAALGRLTGTPTTAGNYDFNVTTAGAGLSATGAYHMDVTTP